MRYVEPLVALQTDEAGVEHAGERLCRLGLAHPGLSIEEERLFQRNREKEGGRESAIGQVLHFPERDLDPVDAREGHTQTVRRSSSHRPCEDRRMEYRQLGRSGLRVSELTLGTMTFGTAGVSERMLGSTT